jgi:arginyl-tRNA synthetase
MIQGEIKRALFFALKKAYPGIDPGDIVIERTKDPSFGDFTTNVSMKISATLRSDPHVISNKIVAEIKSDLFTADAVSGFINFKMANDYFQKQLQKILNEKEKYGCSTILKGKKIQVEFVSANPTGPMHLGNGRGGFGGDVIANVLARLGAKVEREFYVNDAGTQIKTLGESALAAAGFPIETEEIYRGAYIDEWIKGKKSELKKLQEDPYKIGDKFATEIMSRYIKPTLGSMNIAFDSFFSEKSLTSKGLIDKTVKDLKKRDLLYEEDGAWWFRATKYGENTDHVVIRSDGEPAYFLGDIAYHYNKLIERKFDKVIDIWGADHHGHVERMQAAIRAMGQAGKLDIIITQLVRLIKGGKEFKMSKRKGTSVTMEDLFSLIAGTEKKLTPSQQRDASDVARFFFLSRDFKTHMDFDLDLAREHSEKNPVFYVKYAHARICSILAKATKYRAGKANLALLTDPKEVELIREVSKLPELLIAIAADRNYPIHHLTFYVRSVAGAFHSFYDACRVIDDKNTELTKARLKLVEATQIVLRVVMEDLIGIDAPKKM